VSILGRGILNQEINMRIGKFFYILSEIASLLKELETKEIPLPP